MRARQYSFAFRERLTDGAIAVVLGAQLLASMTSASNAQQPSAALQAKAINAPLLAAQAAKGLVRVIVHYKVDGAPTSSIKPDDNVESRMRLNAVARDALLATHFRNPADLISAARALRRMRITPAFAINASAAEIEALAADDRVLTIKLDQLGKPQLLQSLPLIGSEGASSTYLATGKGWAVAILDSGVEAAHAFLAGKVIGEACFSTTTGSLGSGGSASVCPGGAAFSTVPGSGANCDVTWNGCEHGTHVAGIAAGFNTRYEPGQPINGGARAANIVSIQIYSEFTGSDCANQGRSSPCISFWFSDFQAALDYVYSIRDSLPQGIQMASVNLSGGDGDFTSNCDAENPSLKASIDNLRSANIPTIISAGNDGRRGTISQPACISSAIAVAASTKSDTVSSFSQVSSQTALFAPGGEIASAPAPVLSSVPAGYGCANFSGPNPTAGGSYCYLAGSSMSAAHVSGAWAQIRSVAPNASLNQILDALINTGTPITVPLPGGSFTKPRIRVDLALLALGTPPATPIFAAVLPNARTTTVGTSVTAFASIINAGGSSANACTISLPVDVAGTLFYQTTEPTTNQPNGIPNTAVNIAPGQSQSFFFAITPSQIFQEDIPLVFACRNAAPAPRISGVDTFLLSVGETALPDMLSIAETLTHDGNMKITGADGIGVMAVASIDLGSAGTITFTPADAPFGQPARNLPLTLSICQTDAMGRCINPTLPASSSTVNVAQKETVFFSIFAQGQGQMIPYDPANRRVFVIVTAGSAAVGEASVAIKMQ